MSEILIREATIKDASLILGFIKELATFEKAENEVIATVEDIKKEIIPDRTKLVFVMHINNETGSINNIEEIQKYCRRKKIIYFSPRFISINYKLENTTSF